MGDKSNRLIALEMENFQSITDRVRLDFSPITLLYGPNSAGKSSVFDALELLKIIFNPERTSSETLNGLITRWAHQSSVSSESDLRSLSLAVEICPQAEYRESTYKRYERANHSIDWSNSLDAIIEYGVIRFEYGIRIEGYDIWLDKLSISATVTDDNVTEDFKILDLSKGGLDENGDSTVDVYLYLNDFNTNWHEGFHYRTEKMFFAEFIKEPLVVVGDKFCYARFSAYGSSIYYNDVREERNLGFEFRKYIEAYTDTISYFGEMLFDVIKEALPLVKADRSIPTPNELIFLSEGINLERGNSDAESLLWHSGILPPFNVSAFHNKDYFYGMLANFSHFHDTYLRLKNTVFTDESSNVSLKQHISPNSPKLKKFQRINKYLSDFLFLEKGYRVASDSQYLIPSYHLDSISVDKVARCSALTRVFLVDSSGRNLEIEDVGSGIAFVLPILVTVSHNVISLIQQPELHLHPALQAALAEVFIDRFMETDVEYCWQSIIETHSEHILLRILRRIRETEQGKNLSTKLTPEDVAVYYFNPNPQGGTEVRKMLITPLGDFYNTWPRGFFDERYKDLFDE